MRRHLRSLAGDSAGNAIVEFALVMPLLLLLIVGSLELAIMLLVGGSLEAAVLAASRYGTTGYEGGVSREARIRQIIGERTFGLVDLDRATIETLVYPSFSDIGHPEPFTDANRNGRYDAGEPFIDINGNGQRDQDMGRPSTGGACDVVLYVVTYDTGPLTGLFQPITGPITHRASVAVRNEPYGGAPC